MSRKKGTKVNEIMNSFTELFYSVFYTFLTKLHDYFILQETPRATKKFKSQTSVYLSIARVKIKFFNIFLWVPTRENDREFLCTVLKITVGHLDIVNQIWR